MVVGVFKPSRTHTSHFAIHNTMNPSSIAPHPQDVERLQHLVGVWQKLGFAVDVLLPTVSTSVQFRYNSGHIIDFNLPILSWKKRLEEVSREMVLLTVVNIFHAILDELWAFSNILEDEHISDDHVTVFKKIICQVLDLPVVREVQIEAHWYQCSLICYCLSILFTDIDYYEIITEGITIFLVELHKEFTRRRKAWKKCLRQRQRALGLSKESLTSSVWTPRRLERWLALANGDSKMEEFIFKGCEIDSVGVGGGVEVA
jgi:hypothetical protein